MDTPQMALFTLEPEQPPKPSREHQSPILPLDDIIDSGPVECDHGRCKQRGIYRNGTSVKCEKHAYGMMKAKNGKAPHVLHCPDGFNTQRTKPYLALSPRRLGTGTSLL